VSGEKRLEEILTGSVTRLNLIWWNRPMSYIWVAGLIGPQHSQMHSFALESRRFHEAPGREA